MNYFVTAIGTDSGKTLVSAIICEMMEADYWKPVQAGTPRDTDTVRDLVSNQRTVLHPERYLLRMPASPHAAARAEGIEIKLSSIITPSTKNSIVIEGAGGCMVPLNDDHFIIDLISQLKTEVILVANLYLGSINHTLLTFHALRQRHLSVKGIVFNGDKNEESERIILRHTGLRRLLDIRREPVINNEVVKMYAARLRDNWNG